MRLSEFDYHLPASRIAQEPLGDRSASRLMVVDRSGGQVEHAQFRDLPSLLRAGDAIVLNRSRVIPARLLVVRPSGGRAELFVSRIVDDRYFMAIGTPLKKLRAGDIVTGPHREFSCRIVGREGEREVRVEVNSPGTVTDLLEQFGHVPLPPYIHRADGPSDRERYQTVFADERGSVAAPTAGLHFDERLLGEMESHGIAVCKLLLHVGLGTFLPLDSEAVEDNTLHAERFSIDEATVSRLANVKAVGGRIVAVGTTVTRVLETAHRRGLFGGEVEKAYHGETDLFIYPGYAFGFVDQLITNFHLPKSSLLLLVCAFLGTERTLDCYEAAVRERYRFYSYGDAMFIR